MSAGELPASAPARRTVGAGAVLTTAGAVLTAATGGALGILVARVLGPADTGAYNLASATLLVLVTVSGLGLNTGAIYYASGRGWSSRDAFAHLQLAALGLGVLGAGIGVLAVVVGRHSVFEGLPLTTLLPVLLAVPFWLSWNFAAALALALDRYEASAAGPLASNLATLVLMAFLAPLAGVEGAILALALGQGLSAIGFIAWGARRLGRPEAGWLGRTRGQLARAVRFGGQTYLPAILQLLNYRADLFILAAVASRTTVGHYSVALIVTELGMLAPRALATVVLPRVARLDAEASEAERTMVELKSVRHTILLMVPTAGVLAVGVLAIPVVFGSRFSDAVAPGLILTLGTGSVGLASVLSATVVGRGYPRYALLSTLLVTPPTVGLYALLIPRHGATGAATASTLSYCFSALVVLYFFQRVTSTPFTSLLPGRHEISDYRAAARRVSIRLRRRHP